MSVRQKYGGSPWLYDEATGDIVGVKDPDGSEFLWSRRSYLGLFYDTTNQTDGSGAVPMSFNTAAIEQGIRIVDGTKIYADRAGIYNWQLSVHLHNVDSQAHYFELWGKKNGIDIPNSRFIYSVPSSHGGSPGTIIPSQNFFIPMNANDYVQIYWATDNVDVTIAYHAAETSPAKPAAPSLLLTVDEIGP
jgi:hypothetical protein